MPTVTVRYWAGAQAAAGVREERLDGDSVAAVLAEATHRHTALEPVLRVASVLVDGRRAEPTTALDESSTVEVLPPFAGG